MATARHFSTMIYAFLVERNTTSKYLSVQIQQQKRLKKVSTGQQRSKCSRKMYKFDQSVT